MHRASLFVAAGLAVSLIACTPAVVDPEEASPWGAARVVEELRIGVEAGPEELMFGSVHSLAIGHDGTMYVAERQPPVLRMYDAGGRFVRNVGRVGQGPGEYLQINGAKVLPDGNLAIWDVSNRRVSIFTPAGEYLDSFPADSSSVFGRGDLERDMAGNLYVRAVLRIPVEPGSAAARAAAQGPQPVGAAAPVAMQRAYLRYSNDGELLGNVHVPADDPQPTPGFALRHPSGLLDPFQVMTVSCWSPLGYLAVGRGDAYEIELQSPDGVITLARDVPPAALTDEERLEWEAIVEYVSRGATLEYPAIPNTKPYFRDLYAGEGGRIWVHRYAQAEKRDSPPPVTQSQLQLLSWVEPPTFDVFEPDGTFLGTVVLPHDTRALAIRGQQVWAVHTDEAATERIVRYRVELESG